MRRLPIYFLIDVSESMVGEPIQQVEDGLATILKELKTDPYALETVWVSIVVFAGQAKTLVPLQDIVSFYPPKFPIGSGTSLSKGLGHLMYELRNNIVKTTTERKGDWKPVVFLLTDGVPTDDASSAINEWKQNWQGYANLVAISFGDEADVSVLRELTENVLLFNNTSPASYKEFFKWVTASIKTSSVSVENNGSGFELAKVDGEAVSKIDLSKHQAPQIFIDSNFVVLAGKCQNVKRPYLIKYKKTLLPSEINGFTTLSYRLTGAFQADNSYYELSPDNAVQQKIHTDELIGAPSCPCCGNQFGLAVCTCGNVHCVGHEVTNTCPWCGATGTYGVGEGGFDLNRAQG